MEDEPAIPLTTSLKVSPQLYIIVIIIILRLLGRFETCGAYNNRSGVAVCLYSVLCASRVSKEKY